MIPVYTLTFRGGLWLLADDVSDVETRWPTLELALDALRRRAECDTGRVERPTSLVGRPA